MPANFAHYLFGQQLLERLPEPLRAVACCDPELYRIGQHGPDIIFYCRPFLPHSAAHVGFQLHQRPARRFFTQARDTIRREADPRLLAYTLGFLCHFVLDSNCHGYIYQKIKDGRVSHAEIETEFDRLLMLSQHLDPLHTDPTAHLPVDAELCRRVSRIFTPLKPAEIACGLRTMKTLHRLLATPSPSKRYALRRLLQLTHTEQLLGGMLVNPVPNPACYESNETLLALYRFSLEEAVPVAVEYCASVQSGAPLGPRFDRTFQA